MDNIPPEYDKSPKKEVFELVRASLDISGFNITAEDSKRPWGGFFVIDEAQAQNFLKTFFDIIIANKEMDNKISPKILIVEPKKRLSWQYHNRRSELWRIIRGPVGIELSDTDEEKDYSEYDAEQIIEIGKGQRHRLIGLKGYGIVAEAWKHTDPSNPSDEDDIIRLQDDFDRK
jgi:mannose-6-phosphate isomerase